MGEGINNSIAYPPTKVKYCCFLNDFLLLLFFFPWSQLKVVLAIIAGRAFIVLLLALPVGEGAGKGWSQAPGTAPPWAASVGAPHGAELVCFA